MNTLLRAIVLLALILTLSACSAPRQADPPTATPTHIPTATPTPEPTALPTDLPTATPSPTRTPVPPTSTPEEVQLPIPSGEPLSEWEGIPVMPEASAGEGDSGGYTFVTDALPADVQAYYERTMPNLGWNLFATGDRDDQTLMLLFMKDAAILTVSVLPRDDGRTLVLLVK